MPPFLSLSAAAGTTSTTPALLVFLLVTLLVLNPIRTTAAQQQQQVFSYLAAPEILWRASIAPQAEGNACAYSPTSLLVCTSGDGSITAFDPKADTNPIAPVWSYTPPELGTTMSSASGVTFSASENFKSFAVYGTTDLLVDASFVCRAHAISMDTGDNLWSSEPLTGSCSGTPVVGLEGDYVYLTHSESLSGTFSILRADDGSILFQDTDDTQPLSPPGIFHNPIRGGYVGGEANRNDMLVWANKPFPGEIGVLKMSNTYGFQFPIGFAGGTFGLQVITLIEDAGFQANAPPLILNLGTSMYWGISRNAVVGWSDRAFDVDPGGNRVSYSPRGMPSSRPIIAKLASSRGLGVPVLFTGSAENHFGAIDIDEEQDGNMVEKWTLVTDSPIYSQAQVSPDDTVVYAIEELGIVHQIEVDTGTVLWSTSILGFVRASAFAQSVEGDAIYFADSLGIVYALKVGEFSATTPAPVGGPHPVVTMDPSVDPIVAPTVLTSSPDNPTAAPVAIMTDAPVTTPAPTDAPVPIMTDAPVTAPVAKPIDNGGKGMRGIGDMGRGKKGGGGTMGMGKRRGLHPSTTDAVPRGLL